MSFAVFQPNPELFECVSCTHLGVCSVVRSDPKLILQHYRCLSWEGVAQREVIDARVKALNQFGEGMLEVLAGIEHKEG